METPETTANTEPWQTETMAILILKHFSMMILNWVSDSCFALLSFIGVIGASGTLIN